MTSDPFCGNCGYQLTGLTDSSKCPECGKPIVEVLQRGQSLPHGRRYRSATHIFGLPLVDVAIGAHGKQRIGRARGIIAIGDIAVGLIAMGNIVAVGVVSLGGALGIGVLSLSACAVGILAFGGLAAGGWAWGGIAAGVIATGGLAAGWLAVGGMAIGHYAAGGAAMGPHVVTALQRDPAAAQALADFAWLVGSFPPTPSSMFSTMAWFAAAAIVLAALVGIVVGSGYLLGYVERR
jgi:hypothetical protein